MGELTQEEQDALDRLDNIERVVGELLDSADPERFANTVGYLSGFHLASAVAVLESCSQGHLRWVPREMWSSWLSFAPAALRLPLQQLALRREMGPEHASPHPSRDYDLLNARDTVYRLLKLRHRAEVQDRLKRRRVSRSR